jgi:hypothetical protein
MLLLFAVLAPRSAQWKWPHGVAYPILEMLVAPLTGCIPFWHGHSELLVSSGSRLLFDVLAIHVVCPNRIAGIRLFGGVAILGHRLFGSRSRGLHWHCCQSLSEWARCLRGFRSDLTGAAPVFGGNSHHSFSLASNHLYTAMAGVGVAFGHVRSYHRCIDPGSSRSDVMNWIGPRVNRTCCPHRSETPRR